MTLNELAEEFGIEVAVVRAVKVCPKCKVEKSADEFSKRSDTKSGLKSHCKSCIKETYTLNSVSVRARNARYDATHRITRNEYQKKYRAENKEMLKEKRDRHYELNREKLNDRQKKYYEANKERVKNRRKKYYHLNKEKVKTYNSLNREKITRKHKEYYEKNKKQINTYTNKWRVDRARRDPLFMASCRIRNLIRASLVSRGFRKTSRTFKLLGCSPQDLLDKWGIVKIPAGWHIDHICPMSQAQDVGEVEKLCHYSNLRILPAAENLRKSDKATEEGLRACRELLGREWIHTSRSIEDSGKGDNK